MVYRPLSFEDDLFTARVYKRNYRTPKMQSFFQFNSQRNENKRTQLSPIIEPEIEPRVKAEAESFISCISSKSDDPSSLISELTGKHGQRRGLFYRLRDSLTNEDDRSSSVGMTSDGPIPDVAMRTQHVTQFSPLAKLDNQFMKQGESGWKDLVANMRSNGHTGISTQNPSPPMSRQQQKSILLPSLENHTCSYMQDSQGVQPVHIALRMNSPEVVKMLLDAGADIHCIDGFCYQPIHSASAYIENPNIIRMLVRSGANVEAEGLFGDKPLMLSCRHGHVGTVRALLDLGATISPCLLRKVVASLHDTIVRELLAHGANPDTQCLRAGKTLLLILAARASTSDGAFSAESNILRMLHLYGADFNTHDHKGNTVLHVLAKRQWLELSVDKSLHEEALIHHVLDFGADVNAMNAERETPLFLAARKLNVWLFELFIDRGARKLTESEMVRLKLDLAAARLDRDGPQDHRTRKQIVEGRKIRIQQILQLSQRQ